MFKKWFVTAYREIQVWALKLNIWYQDLIGVPYKNVFPNIFCHWNMSIVLKSCLETRHCG